MISEYHTPDYRYTIDKVDRETQVDMNFIDSNAALSQMSMGCYRNKMDALDLDEIDLDFSEVDKLDSKTDFLYGSDLTVIEETNEETEQKHEQADARIGLHNDNQNRGAVENLKSDSRVTSSYEDGDETGACMENLLRCQLFSGFSQGLGALRVSNSDATTTSQSFVELPVRTSETVVHVSTSHCYESGPAVHHCKNLPAHRLNGCCLTSGVIKEIIAELLSTIEARTFSCGPNKGLQVNMIVGAQNEEHKEESMTQSRAKGRIPPGNMRTSQRVLCGNTFTIKSRRANDFYSTDGDTSMTHSLNKTHSFINKTYSMESESDLEQTVRSLLQENLEKVIRAVVRENMHPCLKMTKVSRTYTSSRSTVNIEIIFYCLNLCYVSQCSACFFSSSTNLIWTFSRKIAFWIPIGSSFL